MAFAATDMGVEVLPQGFAAMSVNVNLSLQKGKRSHQFRFKD
jgi:hypothetical protein